jgi:hypothetical protein
LDGIVFLIAATLSNKSTHESDELELNNILGFGVYVRIGQIVAHDSSFCKEAR